MNIAPNVDQALKQRRLEVFTVEGVAANVLVADEMAWKGLQEVLGNDSLRAWDCKVMLHDYVPADATQSGEPAVKFHAEFLRQPDETE
jgi:hypothetical protein